MVRAAMLLALATCIAGCGGERDDRPARASRALFGGRPVAWRTLAMSRHPEAGVLDLQCDSFGYKIDCGAGTYTWLLGDSTDRPNVAHFTLTPTELDSIWSWLLDADYFDMPREMQNVQHFVVPQGIKSKIDVRVREAHFSAEVEAAFSPFTIPSPNRGADLDALCDRITRLVEQKPAVQSLPRPNRRPLIL
jgi:hypothetical protein